jgi:toxin CcdB
MAAFDLHRLAEIEGGGLVVDVQSDLIDVLDTRVVVPLLPIGGAPKRAARLNPVLALPASAFSGPDGSVALFPQFIAAVPRGALGPPVGSLADERDRIRDALDMLFLGF